MNADWSFARRPFWVFSHLLAVTVVVSFVLLGFWQLSRHHWRAALNEQIGSRSTAAPLELGQALTRPESELDYLAVTGRGTYVDGDLVRVANRTQGGVAGEHLVALFELDGGQLVLVNRGFAPVNTTVEVGAAPGGPVTLTGWLRESVERGWLGAVDNGESDRVPRLDVEAIEGRLEELVAPLWVQLASDGSVSRPDAFPAPVPLPELDPGPHLGYMGQWFIFSLLGAGFYVALLRRWSRHGGKPVEVPA